MALHDDGGYAGNVGRPLGDFIVPPAYGISFFNKMIDEPLTSLNLTSKTPSIFAYNEQLGDTNLQYSRVLHFSIYDGSTGRSIYEPKYIPYIESSSISGNKTTFNTKPLIEVINPTFYQLSASSFVVYFFSNFTSAELPDGNIYNDDPQYLRRLVEFSTNRPDQLDGNTPSGLSEPYPNDRNYYIDDPPEDETPRTAFLSCVIRVVIMQAEGAGSSSTSTEDTVFAIAEKPLIVTWIGHRFSLDNHPPLLVNTTQSVEWATDKTASDSLDDDAVNANPPRQIPYHHVVSGIDAVMYPGYAGINFYTQPITHFYDISLDHYFEVGGAASKQFDIYAQGRKLQSIGVQQRDQISLDTSDFSPFERHFAVFQIDMDDFRNFSSSSSSEAPTPSYIVEVPAEINIRGDDKPEFWLDYWQVCGSSSGGSGGEIAVDFQGDGSWYGEACIDGIQMYAKLQERPYGYYNIDRAKFWLTIGPLTLLGVELDIVWQGYKVSGITGDGNYTRFYGLGDGTPTSITLSEA